MKTVVIGANGFLGRNIVRRLAKGGVDVVGLDRKTSNKHIVGELPETKLVDYELELSHHLTDAKCLIHVAGISGQNANSTFELVNVNLTRRIVCAAREAGVHRIIYASGLGVSPVNTEAYFLSKYLAEQAILSSGIDYTIFRPSYIIGMGDEITQELIYQVHTGEVTILGSGNYRFQPIWIGDVAEIFFKSVSNKDTSRQIVDLVGPEILSLMDYVKLISRLIGKEPSYTFVDLEKACQTAMREPEKFGLSTDEIDVLISDFVSESRTEERYSLELKRPIDVLKEMLMPRTHS